MYTATPISDGQQLWQVMNAHIQTDAATTKWNCWFGKLGWFRWDFFLPKNIWCHYIICRSWSCNLEKIGSIIFKSPNPKSAFGRKPFEGIRMTPWQRIPESNVISTGPRTSKLKNNGNIYMFVIVTLLKNANHPRCNWYSGIYGCL